MELLLLLVSRRESLVSREEIAERLWGKDLSLRSRNPKLSMTAPGRLIAVSVTEL
jgi:DNA-binding response OmpR family regulator